MKKIILFLLIAIFLISCGPRRMKCYGKRCVENSIKKENSNKRTS
ncbi:hypothetical protein [Flavobacterium sp.]